MLVRHGQTEWNQLNLFRGRADVELDDVGHLQAEAITRRLAILPPTAVYSSPLQRAVDTAKPIAKHFGLEVTVREGLIDIDYGAWQGLGPQEVQQRYPQEYETWLREPHQAFIPGGETLAEVQKRSFATLEGTIQEHPGQTIVLVSHKVVCKMLICAALGLDNSHFWQIEQDNAAINVFEARDSGFTVNLVNDTCHLGPIASAKGRLT